MTTPYQSFEPVQEAVPIGTPFQCPSSGEAFPFTVRVRWWWIGSPQGRGDIQADVKPIMRKTWDQILVTTRKVLRGHEPELAQEAESALNQALDELSGSEQPIPEKVRWSARAEVDCHEDVRDALRRGWVVSKRQNAALAQVEKYEKRILRWRELLATIGLDDLEDKPAPFLAPYLLKLAMKPEEADETVMVMARRREEKDEELMDFLDAAVKGRGAVNLYEYDRAMDTALSRLMQWAGLTPPAEGSGTDGGSPR